MQKGSTCRHDRDIYSIFKQSHTTDLRHMLKITHKDSKDQKKWFNNIKVATLGYHEENKSKLLKYIKSSILHHCLRLLFFITDLLTELRSIRERGSNDWLMFVMILLLQSLGYNFLTILDFWTYIFPGFLTLLCALCIKAESSSFSFWITACSSP